MLALTLASAVAQPVAAGAPTTPPTPLTWASPQAIDRFVTDQMGQLRLPGIAVVLLRDGRPYADIVHGDAAPGRPVTLDTPFLLGSTSKQFTGLAVQQLIAAGRLTLDTPVSAVLPGFGTSDHDPKRSITIRELLAQTSGLSTATGLAQWGWQLDRPPSIAANATVIAHATLNRPPGRSFEYSNSNYDLLGAIIEAVTGKPYKDALRDLVLQPAGLAHTTADRAAAQNNGLASGYYTWFGVFTRDTPSPRLPGAVASSGVASTGRDLARLLQAHLAAARTDIDGKVLAATRAPLTKAGEFSSYASGWYYRPLWEAHAKDADWQNPSLPRCVAHSGDTTRSMSYLMACPTIGFGVVALTNVGPAPDSDRWDRFTDGLVHAALGTTPPTYRTDPVAGHAAAIMLTVLLIQLAALMALLRATRRQRPARLVSATAIAVSLGALWLGWIYAPHYHEQPAPVTAVWDGAPDLAVTTFTASVLALITMATVVTSFGKRWRTATDEHA